MFKILILMHFDVLIVVRLHQKNVSRYIQEVYQIQFESN